MFFLCFSFSKYITSQIIPYIWEILKSNHYGNRFITLAGYDQCVAITSFR
nr:MAG TPA_asm: hypothetical protein [Caudoviricetes sp.]